MAPGTNSGCKGGSACPTGTVPKMKTRKKLPIRQSTPLQLMSSHQQQHQLSHLTHQAPARFVFEGGTNGNPSISLGSHQRVVYNNIPKNQVPYWRGSEFSPSRSSNNHDSLSDYYDTVSDESGSLDNRCGLDLSSLEGDCGPEVNGSVNAQHALQMQRLRMNGNDMVSGVMPSPSESSQQNLLLNGSEIGLNVRVSPEHGMHQESCQTGSDGKKTNISSSPERMQVAVRLNQIQDYIKQTASLIESFKRSHPGENNEPNVEFLRGVLKELNDSEKKLLTLLSGFDKLIKEDACKICMDPGCVDTVEGESDPCTPACPEPSVARSGSAINRLGSASRPAEPRKQNEIKDVVRKIHSIQQEQVALLQKQAQAQEQLREAQKAQNYLFSMASATAKCCAGDFLGDGASGMNVEEQAWDGLVKNLQEQDGSSPAFKVQNQVLNGDGHQYSSSRERKVQDPHRKKQHMDLLTADMTASFKELSAQDEIKEQASSEDSAVEDAMDEYADARAQVRLQGQIVRDKVAELNALRAQLEQAKTLMNISQRREAGPAGQENGPVTTGHVCADQAINIQRQRRTQDDVGSVLDHHDGKPTNPTSKQQHLEMKRAKLKRLQEIFATIREHRSAGLPIPEHLLAELGSDEQAHSGTSRSTSPAHTAPRDEEDAAVEADVEEDDEPESTIGWNQQQMTLSDGATMASELSRGLQERAAHLQAERDGLAALHRQLEGLFSQLNPPQPQDVPSSKAENNGASSGETSQASIGQHRQRAAYKVDDAAQKRLEIFSDIQNKWQQLLDEVAADPSLNSRAAPFLTATLNVMNTVAAHVNPLPSTESSEANDEISEQPAWDQPSERGEVPVRNSHVPYQDPQEQPYESEYPLSSPPNSFSGKRPPTGERAVWSSPAFEDSRASEASVDTLRHSSTLPSEDNPPVISMPTPSPSIFQLHPAESAMITIFQEQSRLAAFSNGVYSTAFDGLRQPMIPAVLTSVPPPPPPGTDMRDREAYYQQLLAAGQLQQQQMLLTAVNQCFHLLKIQQHELRNLSDTVHVLTTGGGGPVGGLPGLPPLGAEPWNGHAAITSPSVPCPPTLNNQVPPGNRTNNYWDNFRSYSRQNLLSASAKSNEGLAHSPSPLVERSHNALRSSTPVAASLVACGHPTAPPPPSAPVCASPPIPLAEAPSLVEAGGMELGVAPAVEFSLSAPLVQNIPRKDKRNLDHYEGAVGAPHRQTTNEIDLRAATRALDDAALPLSAQSFSPSTDDFEVPPMPILRNPAVGLQSRLNHLNFNASSSASLEAPGARNQLNNEGVPFSEVTGPLSNQHYNEFYGYYTADNPREGPRHLNTDYNNAITETDSVSGMGHKRNTGAIKRTHTTVPSMSNNSSAFAPMNYQRNFHTSQVTTYPSSGNTSGNTESSNFSHKLTGVFASANGDSEAILKSSKQQAGQESSRNFGAVNRMSGGIDDFQVTRSQTRSRLRDSDETDARPQVYRDVALEYGDTFMFRGLGLHSPSSAGGQSSASQNVSNVELHNIGPGKNQLKESCFQIRKCPKFQSKSGPRGQITDTTAAAAAAAAVAAVTSSSAQHSGCHRSSSKAQSGNRRRVANKNVQEGPGQTPCHSQTFEEARDGVFAEMFSLISGNESRPTVILQLFRDLQHISPGPLRQTALQLIQQAVSRYQAEGRLPPREEETMCDEERVFRAQSLPGACGSAADAKVNMSATQEGDSLLQVVLGLELASVLSAHADEICSSAVIDEVRRRLDQLVPPSSAASTSNATRAGYYIYSQVNALLESVLAKYQGCRIGDVGREMALNILNSLPTKLMYLRMVEYYGRNNSEAEADSNKDAGCNSYRLAGRASPAKSCSPGSHDFAHMSQHSQSVRQDLREAELIAEVSHGDLTEADQSHIPSHLSLEAAEDDLEAAEAEGDRDSEADREDAAEGSMSASGSESASALHVHVFQLAGAQELDSEPEVEALHEDPDCTAGDGCQIANRDEADGAVSGIGILVAQESLSEEMSSSSLDLNHVQGNQVEVGGAWTLEPSDDRERGLDQVPTRLACDSDRDQENGEKRRPHMLTPSNGPSSP